MQATEPSLVPPEAATPVPGTPTIKRRLAVMVYEFFLLFAVEMLAVLIYILVTGNRQDAIFQHGMKVYLFLVTGLYFTWCWRDSGHTLAMKTWRIKVVQAGHARLPWRTAIVRYLLAWGWFAPALVVCAVFRLHAVSQIAFALMIGMIFWAATAFLGKDRQFLHDRLAKTQLLFLPRKIRLTSKPT